MTDLTEEAVALERLATQKLRAFRAWQNRTVARPRSRVEEMAFQAGWDSAITAARHQTLREVVEPIRDAWSALNFILAFYEPGQRYLDTDAWKNCEANARAVHTRLAAILATLNEGESQHG